MLFEFSVWGGPNSNFLKPGEKRLFDQRKHEWKKPYVFRFLFDKYLLLWGVPKNYSGFIQTQASLSKENFPILNLALAKFKVVVYGR